MAMFVVLAGFTDQGIRNVKETIGRAEAFKEIGQEDRDHRQEPLLDARQIRRRCDLRGTR